MADRRPILTDRERDIVAGNADEIEDRYRYQTVSRTRQRFRMLPKDLEAFAAHGELLDDFLRTIIEAGYYDDFLRVAEEMNQEENDE